MKFSGELFTYNTESNLTAFETGPITSTETVVFIGGLGDGFNAVPFLTSLVKVLSNINWSLIQVQLSSSFNGYGTTNLQTDSKELDSLVSYLLEKRGKTKIVFLGHSTGSQDCYWHNKFGQHNNEIAGYILQAPVSDREHFKANLPGFETYLNLAIQLRKEGKGDELLPRDAFWAPITANRFFSLSSKE
jgi:triacylglycerol esterase/lipase EstA (alpha/beta hydrolase family)